MCFSSHCNWQKENLIIERYRTRALPAQRWQMDYKNVKAKHLKHQGRDARYLNYHSLPRRQWLPDMVHTSRNSANGTAIIQHTPFLRLFFSDFSLALCYIYLTSCWEQLSSRPHKLTNVTRACLSLFRLQESYLFSTFCTMLSATLFFHCFICFVLLVVKIMSLASSVLFEQSGQIKRSQGKQWALLYCKWKIKWWVATPVIIL